MAHVPVNTDGASADGAWPDPRLAWTALFLLMAGLIVSLLDRAVITLFVGPIKSTYGLSDTQFGALQSVAFGTFYITMAIPIGILADRYQRRIVAAIGIAVFSVFALGTGLARNFTQLFIARMGVGTGEASLSPTAFSLISDYFPPEKLGRAMSLFMMSNFVGSSLALIIGGALFEMFEGIHTAQPAALYGFVPWQAVIVCIALPGLVLAPCILMLREPPRRGLIGTQRRLSLRATLRELGKRRTFFIIVAIGMSMGSLMTNAIGAWQPTLFIRVYGWSAGQTGFWLGTLMLIGSVTGSFFAGWLTDRLTLRSKLDAPITVAALSFVAAGVFGVIGPLMPTAELSLVCYGLMLFVKPMAFACVPAALQLVVPNQLRAQVGAGYLTVISLVGLSLGPIVVGIMSDRFFEGPDGIRYSLSIVTAITVPIMAVLMLYARKPYRALREAKEI